MNIEATFGQLLDAHLAPLRTEIAGLRTVVETLRRHLPPALVPLKEACGQFDVSEKTAKRWIKSGKWPGKKIGSRWFVDLAGLHAPDVEEVRRQAAVVRSLPTRGR